MKKNNLLDITKFIKRNGLLKIPNYITEEWLKERLKNEIFLIWGFSFSDLSNCRFEENIDKKIINKIHISTFTKLPKNHPFNINLSDYVDYDIKEIINFGLDGSGVNIAIIDQNFVETHNEIVDSISEHINIADKENSFHGLCVSSNIIGKTIGVAPKSNVIFYGVHSGFTKTHTNSVIKSLNDIYIRNLNGANIRLVNISGYLHTLSPEFDDLKKKLENQNCYIIDSPTFGKNYTCINLRRDGDIKNYEFSDWQLDKCDYYKEKLSIPFPGLLPLFNTVSNYIIGGEVSYSWVIPRLTGLIALCMQLKPDITLDEFNKLAYETRYITSDGKNIINPLEIIKILSNSFEYNIKF